MTVWHWIAALVILILLCGTRNSVRGGILVLLLTFFIARVAYLYVTKEMLP